MLYESLIRKSKSKYDIPLWSNLCSRIAKYHIEEKKISKENPELIAGNVPFTPRHLNFISNDFHHTFRPKKISIETWLQSIFDNYYWRSFIKYLPSKKIEYMENTKKIIKTLPDQQFKVDQELDFNEEFKEIVAYLIQIQKYCISEEDKDNKEFSNILFDDLLNKCLEVPINRVKLHSLYNNICDTILLLDNMQSSDDILKNKYYQIHFIKNNYENILNNFESINEFIEQLTLKDDKLLNNKKIKMYLLRMRFLNEILKNKENKSIYEPDLNYNLFNCYSNCLSQKLLNLIKYKNKSSFEDLVVFMCENPDVFKIIHYYYPYNNNSLKRGQLKLADYYIYIWSHLYLKKYNFSIRIKENRYDIIFTNEDQRNKITPYFVLNEKDSLLLSLKYSYVKKNLKGNKCLYKYIDNNEDNTKEDIEKKTLQILQWVINNCNKLYRESQIKTLEEIDKLNLESYNFFTSTASTLIGRIWSLIINLTDKYNDVLNYFLESFCFLEKDIMKLFIVLYDSLDRNPLQILINNMLSISFFCDSSSMLWKYRNMLNNLKVKPKEKNDNKNKKEIEKKEYEDNEENEDDDLNDDFAQYFKNNEINFDEELKLVEKEKDDLDKLSIYWNDELYYYKGKLTTLQNILITYKNKGREDAEITKLRSEANELMIQLEKMENISSIKQLNFLKDEINQFIKQSNPTKELYYNLKNRVEIFIKLISLKDNNSEIIHLTNKNNIDIKLNFEKYKLYDLLFWYSNIDDCLNELLDPKTEDQISMKISMNLYKDEDLDPILTFINERKLELSRINENKNLPFREKQKIKQMVRGILLLKLKSKNINLDDFNNFVNYMNSRINQSEEIDEEEYYFSYMIAHKYQKNLKIIIPFFEPLDVFYLFYKYDKGKKYKLGDIFIGNVSDFAGLNDIPEEIFKKEFNDMNEIAENLAILFCENICGKKYEKKIPLKEYLTQEMNVAENSDTQNLLRRILTITSYVKDFQKKIYNNQKENPDNYKFKLDDFKNLLTKNNKLMNCAKIFKVEKGNIDKGNIKLQPSLIFFIHNNQPFIDDLFNNINNSDKSIIDDLDKKRDINYLPFWLYILRNISSLNCLEYGGKDIDKKISDKIVKEIKKKISYCLDNKKPLNLQWLNLLVDNVSSDLLEQNIHLFFNFFNSLINHLNLSKKILKSIAIDEITDYFKEIIDSVFDFKFNELLNCEIMNNDNKIIQFTKDPSKFIYEKMKSYVNDKFYNILIEKKIIEKIEEFIHNNNDLHPKFEKETKDANKLLFEKEFNILKENHIKELENIFSNLSKCISNNNSFIEQILKKKNNDKSNKKITNEDIKILLNNKEEIESYEKYGLKRHEKDNLICFKLPYNFNEIKEKQYFLYYLNKIIEIPNDLNEGYIYIINNENNNDFKKNFSIEIRDINDKNDEIKGDEREQNKEKEDEKIFEKYVDFSKVIQIIFPRYNIENDEEIKKLINENNHPPTENDITNPKLILFDGYKEEKFFENVNALEKEVEILYKYIKIKDDNKISDRKMIEEFEKNVINIIKLLEQIIDMLNSISNNIGFESFNNISKDFEKNIYDFKVDLNNYYETYNERIKNLLYDFSEINEKNIFNLDFSLSKIPNESRKSFIPLNKMNEKSENLCVPIINIDSDGKNLICCYKTLELNLGKTCPALYHKPYVINIISFVNEDLSVKIKSYKESKIDLKSSKIEEKEEKEEKEIEIKEINNVSFCEEIANKLLKVKELIKR